MLIRVLYHSEKIDEDVGADDIKDDEQCKSELWRPAVAFSNTAGREHGIIVHQEVLKEKVMYIMYEAHRQK
jgi:hypothetical protein